MLRESNAAEATTLYGMRHQREQYYDGNKQQ